MFQCRGKVLFITLGAFFHLSFTLTSEKRAADGNLSVHYVLFGGSVTFVCDNNNLTTLMTSWRDPKSDTIGQDRNNSSQSKYEIGYDVIKQSSTLTVHNVSFQDGGIFTCVWESWDNSTNNQMQKFQLRMIMPPPKPLRCHVINVKSVNSAIHCYSDMKLGNHVIFHLVQSNQGNEVKVASSGLPRFDLNHMNLNSTTKKDKTLILRVCALSVYLETAKSCGEKLKVSLSSPTSSLDYTNDLSDGDIITISVTTASVVIVIIATIIIFCCFRLERRHLASHRKQPNSTRNLEDQTLSASTAGTTDDVCDKHNKGQNPELMAFNFSTERSEDSTSSHRHDLQRTTSIVLHPSPVVVLSNRTSSVTNISEDSISIRSHNNNSSKYSFYKRFVPRNISVRRNEKYRSQNKSGSAVSGDYDTPKVSHFEKSKSGVNKIHDYINISKEYDLALKERYDHSRETDFFPKNGLESKSNPNYKREEDVNRTSMETQGYVNMMAFDPKNCNRGEKKHISFEYSVAGAGKKTRIDLESVKNNSLVNNGVTGDDPFENKAVSQSHTNTEISNKSMNVGANDSMKDLSRFTMTNEITSSSSLTGIPDSSNSSNHFGMQQRFSTESRNKSKNDTFNGYDILPSADELDDVNHKQRQRQTNEHNIFNEQGQSRSSGIQNRPQTLHYSGQNTTSFKPTPTYFFPGRQGSANSLSQGHEKSRSNINLAEKSMTKPHHIYQSTPDLSTLPEDHFLESLYLKRGQCSSEINNRQPKSASNDALFRKNELEYDISVKPNKDRTCTISFGEGTAAVLTREISQESIYRYFYRKRLTVVSPDFELPPKLPPKKYRARRHHFLTTSSSNLPIKDDAVIYDVPKFRKDDSKDDSSNPTQDSNSMPYYCHAKMKLQSKLVPMQKVDSENKSTSHSNAKSLRRDHEQSLHKSRNFQTLVQQSSTPLRFHRSRSLQSLRKRRRQPQDTALLNTTNSNGDYFINRKALKTEEDDVPQEKRMNRLRRSRSLPLFGARKRRHDGEAEAKYFKRYWNRGELLPSKASSPGNCWFLSV